MNQQAIDHHLLSYCMASIEDIEESIYKAQIRLEHYVKMRDILLDKIAGADEETGDLLLEKIEEEQ